MHDAVVAMCLVRRTFHSLYFFWVDYSKLRKLILLKVLQHLLLRRLGQVEASVGQLQQLVVGEDLVLLRLVDLTNLSLIIGISFVEHHRINESRV